MRYDAAMSDYSRLQEALHAHYAGRPVETIAAQALGYLASAAPSAGGDYQGIADAIRELYGISLSAADVQTLSEEKQRLERGSR